MSDTPTLTCEWCYCEVRDGFMDRHLATHSGSPHASLIHSANPTLYDRMLAATTAEYQRLWRQP